MGMGIGTFLPNHAIIKRRYRWTLSFEGDAVIGSGGAPIKPIYVQIAARPNLTIESTELNFMNEKDFIPAKPSWEPINVTVLDFGQSGGNGADVSILQWIQQNYVFGDPSISGQMSDPAGYGRRNGLLTMYNGVEQIIEQWTLWGCWIENSNWGDLDYSATENATIELQIRFQNAACQLFATSGAVGQQSPNYLSAFEGSTNNSSGGTNGNAQVLR